MQIKNQLTNPTMQYIIKEKKILHCSIEKKETKKDGFKVS